MVTKGEWEILTSTETNTKTLVAGNDSGMVADCYYHWRDEAECEANAHLIAAAPDMYEALREIIQAIDNNQATIGYGREQRLRDILAKASQLQK